MAVQANQKMQNWVPQHEMRRAAIVLGLKAHLASTLADVAFWLQGPKYDLRGEPGVWLTGAMLKERLGIHPRTANRHLRTLAKKEYIRVDYAPSPGPYLRVTWVFRTDKTSELIELGRRLSEERKAPKRHAPHEHFHEDVDVY